MVGFVIRYRHNKQTDFFRQSTSQQISHNRYIDVETGLVRWALMNVFCNNNLPFQEILQLFSHHIAGVATHQVARFSNAQRCTTIIVWQILQREKSADCSFPATHPPAAHYKFTFPWEFLQMSSGIVGSGRGGSIPCSRLADYLGFHQQFIGSNLSPQICLFQLGPLEKSRFRFNKTSFSFVHTPARQINSWKWYGYLGPISRAGLLRRKKTNDPKNTK